MKLMENFSTCFRELVLAVFIVK